MKKTLFILLTIASLTACAGKKEKIEKPIVTSEIIEENNGETNTGEVVEYDISDMAEFNEIELQKICYTDEVKNISDPKLQELYGDLAYLQERADEWAKFPRTLDELEEITMEIGLLKGKIQFRSLEVYSKIY